MSETLIIEAVNDKYKNKYNSGSVLANGKWMQVSSKLNLADFQKDSQVTVETETNDKGYTSIVALVKNVANGSIQQKNEISPVSSTAGAASTYRTVDREEGQREGNRRNVAATITNGLTLANSLTEEAAFETYQRIHQKLVDLDNNG